MRTYVYWKRTGGMAGILFGPVLKFTFGGGRGESDARAVILDADFRWAEEWLRRPSRCAISGSLS